LGSGLAPDVIARATAIFDLRCALRSTILERTIEMKNLRALLVAATVSTVAACANVPTFGEEGLLTAPRLDAASKATTTVQDPAGEGECLATTSSSAPGDSPDDGGDTARGGHTFGSGS
jgi:hypothetical protein